MDIEQIRNEHKPVDRTPRFGALRLAMSVVMIIVVAVGSMMLASKLTTYLFTPDDPAIRAAEIDERDRKYYAQELVKLLLKDEESAKFRDIYVTEHAVCGTVNAKNGFGAYTGFERFISDGKKEALLESTLGTDRMDLLWPTFCQRKK